MASHIAMGAAPPPPYHASALPAELRRRGACTIVQRSSRLLYGPQPTPREGRSWVEDRMHS
jgi:hypothetical protein